MSPIDPLTLAFITVMFLTVTLMFMSLLTLAILAYIIVKLQQQIDDMQMTMPSFPLHEDANPQGHNEDGEDDGISFSA